MDTRAKIISGADAERLAQGATVVSGYFDPLVSWHARRLAELKHNTPLVVVITDPPSPILPARARAELVAGLRAVDYVVESGAAGLNINVHLEREDAEGFERLIEHVHWRQRGASASR